LQYFSPSIFYALTWPDLKKIVLSSRIGNYLTQNNQRRRIPRWLEWENEENVARTRSWCGWPSSPPWTELNHLSYCLMFAIVIFFYSFVCFRFKFKIFNHSLRSGIRILNLNLKKSKNSSFKNIERYNYCNQATF